MKLDIPIQMAIAQCWLVSHIVCYPLFNSRTENRDISKDIHLKPRALTTSFMPGFGKRTKLQNEARSRTAHQSALGKYGSDLEGRIRDGIYALIDSSNSDDLIDDTQDEGESFVLDKETLKALIDNYYGRTAENVESVETDLPQRWYKQKNQDRLLDSIMKLRAMERQTFINNDQAWRDNTLQTDDLKL